MSYASITIGKNASNSANVVVAAPARAEVDDMPAFLFDNKVKVRWAKVKAKRSSTSRIEAMAALEVAVANNKSPVESETIPKAKTVAKVGPAVTDHDIPKVKAVAIVEATMTENESPVASDLGSSWAVNGDRPQSPETPRVRGQRFRQLPQYPDTIREPKPRYLVERWDDYVPGAYGYVGGPVVRPSLDDVTMGWFAWYMNRWKQSEVREMAKRDRAVVDEMMAEAAGESPLWPGRPTSCDGNRRQWVQSLDVVRPRALDGLVW